MSAAEFTANPGARPSPNGDLHPYRAISRSAVVAFVLAMFGSLLLCITLWTLLSKWGDATPVGVSTTLLGLLGLSMGLAALVTIRRYPLEYTGKRLAQIAVALALAQVALGSAAAIYTYVSEVPDGYRRTSFGELQPDLDRPELPVAPLSLELSGKKVFIKGYMYPGATLGKVDHFILVNDFGTCCFGGQPKPTHMIEVRITDPQQRIAYSKQTLKLAGTFQLSQPTQSLGLGNVYYHLQVDQVR